MNGRDTGTVRHADGTVGSPEAVAAYAVAREQYMQKNTSSGMEKVKHAQTQKHVKVADTHKRRAYGSSPFVGVDEKKEVSALQNQVKDVSRNGEEWKLWERKRVCKALHAVWTKGLAEWQKTMVDLCNNLKRTPFGIHSANYRFRDRYIK